MFSHIAVWRDKLDPEQGALAHARDWAARLHRPLHVLDPFALPARDVTHAGQYLSSNDLAVVGRSLPKRFQADCFRQSECQGTPLLICPDKWQPLSRLLVLHEDGDADESFIRTAVRLSIYLHARPIVLTTARSEQRAFLHGRGIVEALAAQGLECDVDEFAGLGRGPAICNVATWRRCQVIVTRRWPRRSWWPWPRRETLEPLIAASSSLAFLVLPQGKLPEPSPDWAVSAKSAHDAVLVP